MRKGALLIMTLAVVMIVIGAVFVYKSYSSNTGVVNFKAADGACFPIDFLYPVVKCRQSGSLQEPVDRPGDSP